MNKKELFRLREGMAQAGLQAYIIPSSDEHASEYLHPHFKARAYYSGFRGSAGTLVALLDQAALFTDGRYFLQAEQELAGSGITLMRMGLKDTPTLEEYIYSTLKPGDSVGIYPRVVQAAFAQSLKAALSEKDISLVYTEDLAGACWENRPPMPESPAYLHPLEFAGKSAHEKIALMRTRLMEEGADALVITALDETAWLFNLRGSDIPHNPVSFCHSIVQMGAAYLFMDAGKPTEKLKASLQEAGVTLLPYGEIYTFVKRYRGMRVWADTSTVNAALFGALQEVAKVVEKPSPVMMEKAVKNPVEQNGMREAHLRDGVAMAKFLYFLQKTVAKGELTEVAAAQVLHDLRIGQGAIYDSFAAIVAYGENGAVVHYAPRKETAAQLRPEGLLLVDSGGQYPMGTTDVTRTIPLGPVTALQRRHYTRVLQGMIRLAAAVFPACVYGDQLDVLARSPLWEDGLDYLHGTGHGIGSVLSVHEKPVRIYYKSREANPLRAGMVLSDEPGVYVEGSHGIRIENQLCVKEGQAEGFLAFEVLTLVPIATDIVERALLSESEANWLNAYHARVYEALAPHLGDEERIFLRQATKAI